MPRWRRVTQVLLTISYALMGVAGVTGLVWLSPALGRAGEIWSVTWACFLIVGGSLAAYGAGTRTWWGEYIGCIMLTTSFLAYALSVGYGAMIAHRPATFGLVALLLAFAAMTASQGQVAAAYRKAARATVGHPGGKNDH